MSESLSSAIPPWPGTYALVLSAGVRSSVDIGKLGTLPLLPGFYLYIGSAFGFGGLKARLAHHGKMATRPHWHIDYLRPKTSLESIWYSCDAKKREHLWAEVASEMPGATVLLSRFGASDCSCVAHLFYRSTRMNNENSINESNESKRGLNRRDALIGLMIGGLFTTTTKRTIKKMEETSGARAQIPGG